MAASLDNFRSDQECEVVGYAGWGFDFEARPSVRHVSDDAVNRSGGAEHDRAAFDSAMSWTAPLLGHAQSMTDPYFRPVKYIPPCQ